jgi:hypothetical protein
MAAFMIIAVLVLALVAYVWLRQARHKSVGGRSLDPEALLQQHGKFWGTINGGGF